jgi:hypothetical protein
MIKYIYSSNELIDSTIENILSVFSKTDPVIKKLVESIEDSKRIEKIRDFITSLEKDNKEYINNISSLLKETIEIKEGTECFKKIIEICISSLTKIFEDNTISMKDVPIFINMIMDILNKLKYIKKINIDKSVGLCEFVCKVLIIFMNKNIDTQVFIQILETSVKLAKFDFNKEINNYKSLCFCC